MASIAQIRQQYPQYEDMSDQQLADAIYAKSYSDMPRAEFDAKIGLAPAPVSDTPPPGAKPGSREYAQWALQRATSGNAVPQVGPAPQEYDPGLTGPGGLVDDIATGASTAIEGVPFIGQHLIEGAYRGRAALQGMTPDEVRAETAASRERNPVAATVGSIAGPTLALAPVGMTALGARALGMTGSLPARFGFGLGSGALIAGGDTALRGGSPQDTVLNAGLGGLVGGALPIVGAGIRKAAQTVMGRGIPRDVRNVSRAMVDDGINPATANAQLAAMGPDAMVMDLGPNLQSQAGAVASLPGRGQSVVREAVAARQARAPQRVRADVAQTIGTGRSGYAMREQTIAAQKAAADPLYAKVRDVKVDMLKGNFAFVFGTPMGKQALAQARQMAANDGYKGVDTIQIIDYAKQALDDIAGEAIRQNKGNLARQASNLARVLTSEADKAAPDYKLAREAFAGPAKVLEAMDAGETVFTKEMEPDALRAQMGSMTASEQSAFLESAQAWIAGQMGGAVNEALALRNLFKKGWNEEKLRILLGPDVADDIMRRINREAAFGKSANVVSGNSETARRAVAQGEVAPEYSRMERPQGLTGLLFYAFDKARTSLNGTMQPRTNARMAGLHTAGQLTPKQVQQLARAAIPAVPAMFAPAGVAAGVTGERGPLQIGR